MKINGRASGRGGGGGGSICNNRSYSSGDYGGGVSEEEHEEEHDEYGDDDKEPMLLYLHRDDAFKFIADGDGTFVVREGDGHKDGGYFYTTVVKEEGEGDGTVVVGLVIKMKKVSK